MNPRFDELIQMELDGEISAAERQELDALCDADTEVRDHRARMQALAQDLDAMAWREPGPELKESILREIDSEPVWRSPARSWRLQPTHAYAFAAGVVLMFALGRVIPGIDGVSVDPDAASGTMVRSSTGLLDEARLEQSENWVHATTERRQDRLILRARGEGDGETPVRIEWREDAWSSRAVRASVPGDLRVDRGRAVFSPAAAGSYELELELQVHEATVEPGEVRLQLGTESSGEPWTNLDTAP